LFLLGSFFDPEDVGDMSLGKSVALQRTTRSYTSQNLELKNRKIKM
jgi:hypothetical protein